MNRVPVRPLTFVLLYALLLVGPLLVAPHLEKPLRTGALLVAVVVPFALHVWWIFDAVRFLAAISDRARKIKIACLLIIAWISAVAVTYLLLYEPILAPLIANTALETYVGRDSPLAGLAAVFPLLVFFWLAARALCDVEEGMRSPLHSVLGTFFLVFYLPIGVFFIYPRLRRLISSGAGSPSIPASMTP